MKSWVVLKKYSLRQGPHAFQSGLELAICLQMTLNLESFTF